MPYTTEQLADIQAIKDCALRYCRGVDRLDAALMKSAYWTEATDDHGVYNGPAWPFVDRCMESHLKWRSTNHCIFNHSIELLSASRASGEIYNVTYLFRADADVLDTWHGRYLDEYESRAGEWRIIKRVCIHEGNHSQPIAPMQIAAEAFRQGDCDRTPAEQILNKA